jgi:hypothetical protein
MCGCAIFKTESEQQSRYSEFKRQNPGYYIQLAHACDTVLAEAQPLDHETLLLVMPEKSILPKVVTDLHPKQLWLSYNSVSICFKTNAAFNDFWIGWGPDETHTNVWTLVGNIEGSNRVFYSETRSHN